MWFVVSWLMIFYWIYFTLFVHFISHIVPSIGHEFLCYHHCSLWSPDIAPLAANKPADTSVSDDDNMSSEYDVIMLHLHMSFIIQSYTSWQLLFCPPTLSSIYHPLSIIAFPATPFCHVNDSHKWWKMLCMRQKWFACSISLCVHHVHAF